MNPFWEFFYGRLQSTAAPVFRLRELQRFEPALWEPLIASRILTRAPTPTSIPRLHGTWLEVRRCDKRFFGVDDSDELPAIYPLEEEDVIEYSLGIEAFAEQIRQLNGIYGRTGRLQHGFLPLGRRRVPGVGQLDHFLALGCWSEENAEARLGALAIARGNKLGLFPIMPDIDRLGAFEDKGLFLADLDEAFRINWPPLGTHEGRNPFALLEEGATWKLRFDDVERSIDATKGVAYIAFLVQHPGAVIPARDLERLELPSSGPLNLNGAVATFGEYEKDQDRPFAVVSGAVEGTVSLSREQSAYYRSKLRDYDLAIEEARAEGRALEASEMEEAKDELLRELSGSFSYSVAKGDVEANRVRDRVSRAIKRAYKDIMKKCPEAEAHLQQLISTGFTFCYTRPPEEAWEVRFLKK